MISWKKLCYSLNAMSKLPNGGGCEVEFDYRGKEYIIVYYRDWCSLTRSNDNESQSWTEVRYKSMEELGNAKDFGVCLKEIWNEIENLECKPDIQYESLETILQAYKDALLN